MPSYSRISNSFIALFLGALCIAAQANEVLDANRDVLIGIRANSTPPPVASRNMAILHTAIFDAVNGTAPAYTPYAVAPAAASGANANAAAAAAANYVLNQIYPGQSATWNATYATQIGSLPAGQSRDDGQAWGTLVAQTILASRASDGSGNSIIYTPQSGPGYWQPTPPANAAALLPQWGSVTPFGIMSVSQVTGSLSGPPALNSQEWADQYNETKIWGQKDSPTRIAGGTYLNQTPLFWADGAGTETPPGHWNAIAQTVAFTEGLSLLESARLFATLDIALADAAIAAWDVKYATEFWRPITAIRAGDTDGRLDTEVDLTWTPELTTPPFPEYVSGHSTFSGAGASVLATFIGTDTYSFSTDSDVLGTGVVRDYTTFSEAAAEAGYSRILGGIHFAQANLDGMRMGNEIGEYVSKAYFTAIPEPATGVVMGMSGLALLFRRRRNI